MDFIEERKTTVIMRSSLRKSALISGSSLIVMGLAAGYAYGYVHGNLIVLDDPHRTASNLNEARGLFGSGVLSWLIILVCDLLVAWNLYKYFFPVDKKASAITGVLRGLYSAVLAFAIYRLISAWQMLFTTDQVVGDLMQRVQDFEKYWSLGLIVFGFHLLGLGYLSIKSKTVPVWMGWLLYIAGLCYSLLNGGKALVPQAADGLASAEMILGVPMAIAELGLAVWLIRRGGRPKIKQN